MENATINNGILVTLLLTVIVVIPFLLVAINRKLFKQFSLNNFVKTINRTFIIHLIIFGLILGFALLGSPQKKIIHSFNEIIMELGYASLLIGVAFYVPILIVLNLLDHFKK